MTDRVAMAAEFVIRAMTADDAQEGLKAFAEVVALELAPHGIRVNLLTPGAVKTPLTAGMSDRQRARLVIELQLGLGTPPQKTAPTLLLTASVHDQHRDAV